MAKIQNTDTTSAGENGKQLSLLAGGYVKGTATLEGNLIVSYKTKHTLTLWSSNFTPCDLPKQAKNARLHKNLHMDVCNCQNLEATKTPSAGEWINKLWSIQTMGHYSALERNELSSHKKAWNKLKWILLREKKSVCLIPTMWHSGKGKHGDSNQTRGWRREGWIGRAHGIFKAAELLCPTL